MCIRNSYFLVSKLDSDISGAGTTHELYENMKDEKSDNDEDAKAPPISKEIHSTFHIYFKERSRIVYRSKSIVSPDIDAYFHVLNHFNKGLKKETAAKVKPT